MKTMFDCRRTLLRVEETVEVVSTDMTAVPFERDPIKSLLD